MRGSSFSCPGAEAVNRTSSASPEMSSRTDVRGVPPADFGDWDAAAKRLRNSIIDFEFRDHLKGIQRKGTRLGDHRLLQLGDHRAGPGDPRKVDVRDPRWAWQFRRRPTRGGRQARRPKSMEGCAERAPIDEPGLVAVYAALRMRQLTKTWFRIIRAATRGPEEIWRADLAPRGGIQRRHRFRRGHDLHGDDQANSSEIPPAQHRPSDSAGRWPGSRSARLVEQARPPGDRLS